MISHTGATVVKYGPAVVALSFPQKVLSLFDPVMALALLVGAVAGITWRAGDRRAKGETWDKIGDDILVSCLIGLANLVAAAIAVDIAGVPPLYAIGIAMVIFGKGTDAMEWFADRYMPSRRFRPDVPSTTQRGDGTPAKPDPALDDLARRLDDPDEPKP